MKRFCSILLLLSMLGTGSGLLDALHRAQHARIFAQQWARLVAFNSEHGIQGQTSKPPPAPLIPNPNDCALCFALHSLILVCAIGMALVLLARTPVFVPVAAVVWSSPFIGAVTCRGPPSLV